MEEEKREEEFLKQGNISLILESYNDIFSSFDPRPYSERALSDDFLIECKKAAQDKKETFEIRLLVEKSKRNLIEEPRIKKRLKEHFQHHFNAKQKEIKGIKLEGVMWFILGAIILSIATFIYGNTNFFLKFLEIMLTPAGWFMFWEGLAKIFITARDKMPEYEFYTKMTNAQITFLSY